MIIVPRIISSNFQWINRSNNLDQSGIACQALKVCRGFTYRRTDLMPVLPTSSCVMAKKSTDVGSCTVIPFIVCCLTLTSSRSQFVCPRSYRNILISLQTTRKSYWGCTFQITILGISWKRLCWGGGRCPCSCGIGWSSEILSFDWSTSHIVEPTCKTFMMVASQSLRTTARKLKSKMKTIRV